LAAPAIALLVIFKVYPLVVTLPSSLTESEGFGTPEQFVGLANYAALISDPVFLRAAANTIEFVALSSTGVNVLGFVLALLVTRRQLRGRAFFQTVLF